MKPERPTPPSETMVNLRIVLLAPPKGVDFGLQEGKATLDRTIQRQRSNGGDLHFECAVTVKNNREDGLPNFLGPTTQGPTTGRFIYVRIGKLAGQMDSCWERRIKVPLDAITWEMIEKASKDQSTVLEARLPGTGKDGSPCCATVRPVGGWTCRRSDQ